MDFEKEIELTVSELPDNPPDYVPGTMEDYGTLGGDALIYKVGWVRNPLDGSKYKAVEVTCTACGKTFYLEHRPLGGCGSSWCPSTYGFLAPFDNEVKYHGKDCLCPECGATCEAAHTSRFHYFNKYYILSSNLCLTLHNVRRHLVLLSWKVYRCTDKQGNIKYHGEKYEGVMIIGGKPVRLAGHRRNIGGADYELQHWEAMKKFTIEVNGFSGVEIMPISKAEFEQNESVHSALDVFINENLNCDYINVFQYLKLWCKYPNVENLVRQGMSGYVNSLIESTQENKGYYYEKYYTFDVRKTRKFVNWKEKRPHLMLGIEKEDMPLIKKYSANQVFLYSYAKRVDKVKLPFEFLNKLNKHNIEKSVEFLRQDFHGFKPHFLRTYNYIEKQTLKCERKDIINFQYLKDYWNSLYKVYGTMDKNLLYPGDLRIAHDRTLMLVKEKEDEALSKQIKRTTKKYEKYAFEDPKTGLMIIPCRSHSDLIKEGKLLDHCVASYAKSVASGSICIFFIRKKSEPDIPFFTLELKNGKVQQNRGYKNCSRTPEVIMFEEKWLKFIANGGKVNGKSNNSSTATKRAVT